ncbi:MAG: hypothetical protein ACXWMQ_06815 [Gemmatimonadaceae bacterium]
MTIGDEIPETRELIEVHVTELRLLFNPIDPSPLLEKDLDQKAEEFIVSWARSARRDAQLGLQVYVDRPGVPDEAATVSDAIHHFFGQRALNSGRRLSQLFRVGRTSLLIGVTFLAVAVTLASMVDTALAERPIGALARESLLIGGWVAMWRPLEIFLYDWWPIRAERRLYERLSAMPIRITFEPAAT